MNALSRRFSLVIAMLLWVSGTARAGDGPSDVTDTVRKSFEVRPGGTLHLDMDRGNIIVETIRGDEVRVEVERTVDGSDSERARQMLERHDVSIEKHGNDVHVEARYDEGQSFWSKWRGSDSDDLRVKVRVQVPRRYDVDFATGAGNVQIADIEGEVRGKTGAGNIKLGEVSEAVRIRSGAGNIEVAGAGRAEIETGAGNVQLHNVRGQVRVETGAGNVAAWITRQPEGASVLSSGAGNVTVYLAERVGVDIDASTGMGSAHTDFPLKVEDGWVSKSFAGTIGQGGPALRLSAGMGNVVLKKKR